jgi:hypothetical protein
MINGLLKLFDDPDWRAAAELRHEVLALTGKSAISQKSDQQSHDRLNVPAETRNRADQPALRAHAALASSTEDSCRSRAADRRRGRVGRRRRGCDHAHAGSESARSPNRIEFHAAYRRRTANAATLMHRAALPLRRFTTAGTAAPSGFGSIIWRAANAWMFRLRVILQVTLSAHDSLEPLSAPARG